MALNAARNLADSFGELSASVRRLSSGLRISTAADDPAGLAVRELMRADIASLNQGVRNANDAISMIQTADGALGVIDEKLIRMKELAEQAATGTYNSDQRLIIDSEYQAMASEISRIANATDFNGIHLLNGNLNGNHDGSGLEASGKLKVHFGTANDSAEDYYYIKIASARAEHLFGVEVYRDLETLLSKYYEALDTAEATGNAIGPFADRGTIVRDDIHNAFLGVNGSDWEPESVDEFNEAYQRAIAEANFILGNLYGPGTPSRHGAAQAFLDYDVLGTPTGYIVVSTQQLAQKSLSILDNAIISKDRIRANLGAQQNRLSNTIDNLKTQSLNLQAAESRISDVDVATEMTVYVRSQILANSASAMLAQANALPRMALSLLQG
jgi:flagellin-like hook-associated protein FlgL